MGNITQGGWNQAFHLGMWITSLCGGCFLITLVLYGVTLEKKAKRWQATLLIISTAASILAHPFGFLSLLLSLPLLIAISSIYCEDRQIWMRSVVRNILFVCMGILIAGWWLFPFMASRSWVQPFGAPNLSEYGFAVDLVESRPFVHTPPIVNALALLGILWGALSKKRIPTAFAAISISVFNCPLYMDGMFIFQTYFSILASVPLARFYFLSKILGFSLAGGMSQKALTNVPSVLASIRAYVCKDVENNSCASPTFGFLRSFIRCLGIALAVTLVFPTIRDIVRHVRHQYSFSKEIPIRGYPNYPPYAKNFERAMTQLRSIDPGPGKDSFLRPLSYPKIGVQTNIVESLIPYRFGYGIVTPFYTPTMLLTTRSANGDYLSDVLSGKKYMMTLASSEGYFLTHPGAKHFFRTGDISVIKYDRLLRHSRSDTPRTQRPL